MDKICTIDVPKIFIGKMESQLRVRNFMRLKYPSINAMLGRPPRTNVFFPAAQLEGMLNHFLTTLNAGGLRVYFASYSKAETFPVPANHGELMTLIFAPTTGTSPFADMPFYFHLSPDNAGPFDPSIFILNKKVAQEWVTNYRQSYLIALNQTVGSADPRDTKSIFFSRKQVEELRNEIVCQGATGIRAHFCATNENPETPTPNPKNARLLLDFMITFKIGNEEIDTYIEDRPGYSNRKKSGDLDTGNPCPPNFCDGELLFS